MTDLLNIVLTLRKTLFLVVFTFILGASATANNGNSLFTTLNQQEIVEVDLAFGIQTLISDRSSTEEVKGNFSFTAKNGIPQSWSVKVGLRGRFRRGRCTAMPPLKLNFKKKELEAAGLAKFDDFKLVTQCIEDKEKAKEILFKEYLTYKLYNQITNQSFRVQLLKINFTDTDTRESFTQYGFLIEDTAELRHRLNLKKTNVLFNVAKTQIDREQFRTTALFEYMIGNVDWSLLNSRNLKLFQSGEQITMVPYDFDFSGLVAAPYRTVSRNLGVLKSNDRAYLGYPEDLKTLGTTVALFEVKQSSLVKTIENFKWLERKERTKMIDFLKDFYLQIDNITLPPTTIYMEAETMVEAED